MIKKSLYLILFSLLLTNIALASIDEGHKECEKYYSKIDQLNAENFGLYEYKVYSDYKYPEVEKEENLNTDNASDGPVVVIPLDLPEDESEEEGDYMGIPTCLFSKRTLGGVSLETQITNTDTFVDVNAKIENIEKNVRNYIVDSTINKYCSLDSNSYGLYPIHGSSNTFELVHFGEVACYSENNLSFLENLDIEKVLESAVKNTDFTSEIHYQPQPVISGTTIHN